MEVCRRHLAQQIMAPVDKRVLSQLPNAHCRCPLQLRGNQTTQAEAKSKGCGRAGKHVVFCISSRRASTSTAGGNSDVAADYAIAVPSYDRAQTLEQRTLAALAANGIDCSNRVHIFVVNEKEADAYAKALSPGTYASIVVGDTLGIGKQRDLILSHFGAGSHVVMLDDDIMWFDHCESSERAIDLDRVILKGFELCHQHNCYMWGINNSSNKFFMRPTYSVGWCFFQGPFMGFRVRDDVRLHPEYHDVKEDVQYSLIHCELCGKSLRLNGIGLKARPYGKEPGGLQSHLSKERRIERSRVNQEYLMARYERFIRSWSYDAPHPQMRRSPSHTVKKLSL